MLNQLATVLHSPARAQNECAVHEQMSEGTKIPSDLPTKGNSKGVPHQLYKRVWDIGCGW